MLLIIDFMMGASTLFADDVAIVSIVDDCIEYSIESMVAGFHLYAITYDCAGHVDRMVMVKA